VTDPDEARRHEEELEGAALVEALLALRVGPDPTTEHAAIYEEPAPEGLTVGG
jgi:hypothetical protein